MSFRTFFVGALLALSPTMVSAQQTPSQVYDLVNQTAHCDFSSGVFAFASHADQPRWIAYSQHRTRTYYEVHGAGTANAYLRVIESGVKSTYKINMSVDPKKTTGKLVTVSSLGLDKWCFAKVKEALDIE